MQIREERRSFDNYRDYAFRQKGRFDYTPRELRTIP